MSVETALTARLVGDTALATIVADRVYWIERLQGDAYPGITLQIFDEDRSQHLKGFHSLQMLRVQFDGWALSYAEAKAIKEAAIDCLIPAVTIDGIKFNRGFVRARDMFERATAPSGEKTIFRPSLDFTFHYSVVP